MKGVPISGVDKDLCLQQFANDTNAILLNEDSNVKSFLECFNVFVLPVALLLTTPRLRFCLLVETFPSLSRTLVASKSLLGNI